MEECYREHGEYLRRHVFPHLSEPLRLLMEHVREVRSAACVVRVQAGPCIVFARTIRSGSSDAGSTFGVMRFSRHLLICAFEFHGGGVGE